MADILIIRADELLQTVEERKIAAVLSIEHEGATDAKHGRAPRLAELGHPEIPQKILKFWDSEQVIPGGPDEGQIRDGMQFVMDHLAAGTVIIHCKAGRARSVGVALGVLAMAYPEKPEKELVEMVVQIRSIAAANALVVEIADNITGRGGRLLQALLEDPNMTERRKEVEAARQRYLERNQVEAEALFPEKFPKHPNGVRSEPS